jgi:hypothetical protein
MWITNENLAAFRAWHNGSAIVMDGGLFVDSGGNTLKLSPWPEVPGDMCPLLPKLSTNLSTYPPAVLERMYSTKFGGLYDL